MSPIPDTLTASQDCSSSKKRHRHDEPHQRGFTLVSQAGKDLRGACRVAVDIIALIKEVNLLRGNASPSPPGLYRFAHARAVNLRPHHPQVQHKTKHNDSRQNDGEVKNAQNSVKLGHKKSHKNRDLMYVLSPAHEQNWRALKNNGEIFMCSTIATLQSKSAPPTRSRIT